MNFSGHTLLQVIPKLVGGGAERTTLEVARAFRAAGGRSLVVSSGGGMVGELTAGGSEHEVLPVESKNPWLLAQNASDLARLIERENVTLVHARSRAPAWSALAAARRTDRPFVTTYHGTYSAKTAPKKLYNSVMVRADAVIANSAFTAKEVRRQYASKPYFDAKRLVTIPRGADLSRFGPEAVNEERIEGFRALLGAGLKVVLPGRFTGWKGQAVLIDAARILRETRPDIDARFAAIGRMDEKPGYVEELRALVDRSGLADIFQLLPATDDVPALLMAADIVVSASTDPEAFGRVAVEAQASGRPVVATRHGGALETVLEGRSGLLVPPGDAEALAQALATVNDQGQAGRDEMGRCGMDHARGVFTTEAMTSATLRVYADVLRSRGVTG